MSILTRRTVSYGVLIDVSSGSVGIGIVASRHNDAAPELLYTHREAIRISTKEATPDRIRAMRHALFSAVVNLNQEGLKRLSAHDPHARVDKLLLICGAPWSRTVTRFIHLEEKEPFTVTEDKIAKLIEAVEKQDVDEANLLDATKSLHVKLTERAVVSTLLNGYVVHEPYGKETTELTLAHISGLVPENVLQAVTEIEKSVLHHAKESVHTCALVLYCVLRDTYPHTKHALIVDVSGEATEIAVMRDQVLYQTYIIPMGSNTLSRALAKELHTIPEEAQGHIQAYVAGTTTATIKMAVERVIGQYTEAVEETYATIGKTYVTPQQLFLTAEDAYEHFFANVFRTYRPAATVTLMGTEKTPILANYAEGAAQDLFLSVGARFFHKLHGCGEIS